jgi:putative methionine-R-sulfoxide reductase with GAF domain
MTNFFNRLKTFFKPPVFEGDEEKTRDAKLLHQIVIASWSLPLLAVIGGILNPSISNFVTPAGIILAVTLAIIMVLNHAGKAQLGSTILVGMIFIVFAAINFSSAGEPRPFLLLSVIIIMMSGLLLGTRGALLFSILLVAQHLIILLLNATGIITRQSTPPGLAVNAFMVTAGYLLIGFMLRLAIERIHFAVSQLQSGNRELQQLSNSLEQRVAERTRALTTVSEISTAASTILDTDQLLQQVVDLAKERFNLYHAHIYLLDDSGDALVLSSGAGDIGRQMVAEGHSIPLDREQSLVARAAREKKGVTVNDVTTAPDFLPNPLLPDTHSELAVPMMVGEQVIGVFDVQSEVIGRFTDADIAVQTTLASQAASAIQNSRSFNEIQRSQAQLAEALAISRLGNWEYDVYKDIFTFNDQFYSIFHTTVEKVGGYKMPSADYARKFVHPDDVALVGAEIQKSLESKERYYRTALEHRVIFEDGEIGYISVNVNVERDENGKIIRWYGANQNITERRRLEELNRKRAIEQEAINQITQKIQSTTTIESALQIAARELGHLFGKKPVAISFEVDALAAGETKSQL